MPDPEKTMSEMSRVLSPGGKVVVTVLKKKVSLSDMRKWFKSAGLEPSRMREIPKSEDILCIAR
jgi:ubiquinone/menaquinone biosynthesis C-methylase UbiE